nr:FAD-dependent oxidoreductase [Plastoroseomonas hellenica]
MLAADAVVVCAGVASRRFAAMLGDRINIYPVKGYSIAVHLDDERSRAAAPMVSLLDDATKIVTSRLGRDRFRVAARRSSMARTATSAPTASGRWWPGRRRYSRMSARRGWCPGPGCGR